MNTIDQQSFTPREREILAQLPGGTTYQAIARRLGISPHTVDTHMRRLRIKTGATNRTQLVVVAIELGYLPGRGTTLADAEETTSIASALPGVRSLTPRQVTARSVPPNPPGQTRA